MSWYKFSKDYADAIFEEIQKQEAGAFTNSGEHFEELAVEENEDQFGIETFLNSVRKNSLENPSILNEARQPVRVRSTGQGADGLLKANKDLPIYQGDNYINMSDWNS